MKHDVLQAMIPALASLALALPATAEPLHERIEEAYLTGSAATLEEVRGELRSRLEEGRSTPDDLYTLAYVDWRLNQVLHASKSTEKQRGALLSEALELLEDLVEERPDAESLSLMGGVLGELAGLHPMRAMIFGPRASRALERAAELEPSNPRVLLQQGISYLFTPRAFGGSLEKAEEKLRRARVLFARGGEEPWPSWGRVDVLAWLGQVLAEKGQPAEARAVYEQALELEPRAQWIRYDLLPKVASEATSAEGD